MSYFKLLLLCFFSCFILSCNRADRNNGFASINGEISNLPDGTVYLVNLFDRTKIIDSTESRAGKFTLKVDFQKADQFSMVTIKAKDHNNVIREFFYPTSKLINGKSNFVDYFLLEDVNIAGTYTDFIPKDPNFPRRIKMIKLNTPLDGKQSSVAYHVTLKFPNTSDTSSVGRFYNTIRKYSYSYYLLNEINQNLSLLSNIELIQALDLFNNEIKSTKLWKGLKNLSSKKRSAITSISDLELLNANGVKETVINKSKGSKTVIIFWASWCGPCIQEIPELKVFYKKMLKYNNIKIVSISLDTKPDNWQKALRVHNLPWQQLISSDLSEQRDLLYLLSLSSSIPAIVIVDHNAKILNKFSGYDNSVVLSERLSKSIGN